MASPLQSDSDSRVLVPPSAGTQLEELELPEEPVLEQLNAVTMAKRMAHMVSFETRNVLPHQRMKESLTAYGPLLQELHSEGFGERQRKNKEKAQNGGGGGKTRGGESGGDRKGKHNNNKTANAAGKGGAVGKGGEKKKKDKKVRGSAAAA